jgi:hypothetical protein
MEEAPFRFNLVEPWRGASPFPRQDTARLWGLRVGGSMCVSAFRVEGRIGGVPGGLGVGVGSWDGLVSDED